MFSSLELHSVSTVLSGLIRYNADLSTPPPSTAAQNCELTCGLASAGRRGGRARGEWGMGERGRTPGRLAPYGSKALSFREMGYRIPLGSGPASRRPCESTASPVMCAWPVL